MTLTRTLADGSGTSVTGTLPSGTGGILVLLAHSNDGSADITLNTPGDWNTLHDGYDLSHDDYATKCFWALASDTPDLQVNFASGGSVTVYREDAADLTDPQVIWAGQGTYSFDITRFQSPNLFTQRAGTCVMVWLAQQPADSDNANIDFGTSIFASQQPYSSQPFFTVPGNRREHSYTTGVADELIHPEVTWDTAATGNHQLEMFWIATGPIDNTKPQWTILNKLYQDGAANIDLDMPPGDGDELVLVVIGHWNAAHIEPNQPDDADWSAPVYIRDQGNNDEARYYTAAQADINDLGYTHQDGSRFLRMLGRFKWADASLIEVTTNTTPGATAHNPADVTVGISHYTMVGTGKSGGDPSGDENQWVDSKWTEAVESQDNNTTITAALANDQTITTFDPGTINRVVFDSQEWAWIAIPVYKPLFDPVARAQPANTGLDWPWKYFNAASVDDRVEMDSAGTAIGGDGLASASDNANYMAYRHDLGVNDYEVHVKFTSLGNDTSAEQFGVMARMPDDGVVTDGACDGYMVMLEPVGSNNYDILIRRVDAAARTTLATVATAEPFAVGDELGIRVEGNTITALKNRTTVLGSHTEVANTYPTNRAGGLYMFNQTAGDNIWALDQFEMQTIPATGVTLEQTRFQFFNDDAGEAAATSLAAENTNITVATDDDFRLRGQVAASGDPAALGLKWQLREDGSGDDWEDVTT